MAEGAGVTAGCWGNGARVTPGSWEGPGVRACCWEHGGGVMLTKS